MKTLCRIFPLLLATLLTQVCAAQAPAGAPAGSTALCNDGTYFSGATKSGGCRGHKGIKTWWGPAAGTAAQTTPSAPAAPAKAPAATPQPTPASQAAASQTQSKSKSSSSSAASKTAAPGGGPGLVWVNSSSNVYHCQGSEWYGKTKSGSYMTEAQAKAKGAKPDHGKGCGS